uniref:Uncharacterized protein n=1 Tax=Cacopsylla melanoneura TaxID=428564 RepID=A0A8D8QWA2_9HEMI
MKDVRNLFYLQTYVPTSPMPTLHYRPQQCQGWQKLRVEMLAAQSAVGIQQCCISSNRNVSQGTKETRVIIASKHCATQIEPQRVKNSNFNTCVLIHELCTLSRSTIA